MVNAFSGISESSVSYASPQSTTPTSVSAEATVSKSSTDSGAGETKITKDQLASHKSNSKSGTTNSNDSSAPLQSNGDNVVSGNFGTTGVTGATSSSDSTSSISYGSDDDGEEDTISYGKNPSSSITSFAALAASVGAMNGKVTKDELVSYLQSLTSTGSSSVDNSTEIMFVKNLIAKFGAIADGGQYLTSFGGVSTDVSQYASSMMGEVLSTIELTA